MKATDFEYDGLLLSSYGFMICTFNGGGEQTVTNGSEINWNLVETQYGARWDMTHSKYNNYLTTTFQICKDPCLTEDDDEISVYELRNIMRWLNRKSFHKFKFLEDEYQDFFYMGSFNVSRIEWYGRLIGLELTLTTDRPYAQAEEVNVDFENEVVNNADVYPWSHSLRTTSDDEGYQYVDMTVTLKRGGDLTINNQIDNITTVVKNCYAGEKIHFNYPLIDTSYSDFHYIQDDFNWEYPKLSSTYAERENVFTFSLPCSVNIKYNPIVKVGV